MRHTKGQNVPGDTESGIGNKKEFQKPVSSVGGRMSLEKNHICRAVSACHKFSRVDDFLAQQPR